MISVNYDRKNDVLYMALGQPKPAYSDDRGRGLLFRYAYENNSPCGVTVIDYLQYWERHRPKLETTISDFLGAKREEVKKRLEAVANG